MSRIVKNAAIFASALLALNACSSSPKQPESAVSTTTATASSAKETPKPTGLAKWHINAPNQFSGVNWADVESNYASANLEITADEDFTTRLKTLLNGVMYNLDEYICTNSDPKKAANGVEARLVTCVIQEFQEYSYFISLLDPATQITRIYEIKDISTNKFLGKERESDPERVYSYDIDEIESMPFMGTTAILVSVDRDFKLSYSQGEGNDVSTDYHTYENYILAGDKMNLVTHWSAKHTQQMTDWMSCDKSNPDPKLCPSVQTEEVCKSADFDGKSWSIFKAACL